MAKEQALNDAEKFLDNIRERSGLFVQRTGDYFGFMHRTFQEYFAARYLLEQIGKDRQRGFPGLVDRGRRLDDLWREPFLLAVAYQSSQISKDHDTIIAALVASLLTLA